MNETSVVMTGVVELDDEQAAAVYSEAPNILVVAGAGSGKTRVLTERIRHLVDQGVDPVEIVAITFTNMAADEMRRRLRDIPGIGDAFIGTIHSFANRIYHHSGEMYSLLTEEAEHLIMEEILNYPQHSGLTMKRWLAYRGIQQAIVMGRADESMLENFLTPAEFNVMIRCESFKEKIRKRDNIISFGELITYATEYYTSLGASMSYILVDEFQDIGTREYEFIQALKAEQYFFVGDDYQAIYGFSGGNVDIFHHLVRGDTGFQIYYLQRNYRCAREILDCGERIMQQVSNRIDKKCLCASSAKGSVTIHSREHLDQITRLLAAEQNSWGEWFILTRTNREAYQLADLLDDTAINYCFIRRSDMTLDELDEAMAKNLVKIMTVHSSKGLENRKVILFGKFPLKIPRWWSNFDERRVMYVGVTRAMEELHIFN